MSAWDAARMPTRCDNCGWSGELESWRGCPRCGAGRSGARSAQMQTTHRFERPRQAVVQVKLVKSLGRSPLRVIPRDKDKTGGANRARSGTKNIMVERARALRRQNLSIDEIAERLERHPRTVSRYLEKDPGDTS